MNDTFGESSASGASERVPMFWFEWPLLVYFMLHLFPPVRGPWGNCLPCSGYRWCSLGMSQR